MLKLDNYYTSKYKQRIKESDEFLDMLGKKVGVDLSKEAREKYTISVITDKATNRAG